LFGIIDMLTKSCGGNVHNKGVLTVTPSAGGHAVMTCKTTVDYSSDSGFLSLGCANEWIRFKFKENRVKSNGCSIRAHTVQETRLKSSVIEQSNDCVDCFELDRKTNVANCALSPVTAGINSSTRDMRRDFAIVGGSTDASFEKK
jgi:hypothetical protein